MGVGPLIGFIILVILTVLIIVIFFPKRTRKRIRLWRIIGTVLLIIVLSPIFILAFESFFYFKSDVISDLKKINITLQDDFDIEENEVVGLTDYYRTTTVTISKRDKEHITKIISESENLKNISFGDFYSKGVKWTEEPDSVYNYRFIDEITNELIRESFEKEKDYAAILTSITLRKNDNTLTIRVVD